MGKTENGDRRVALLGVPTSAGSHNAGQEQAPAALRAAGLVARLQATGLEVCGFADLPVERHRPAERENGVRDLARVVDVARRTAGEVARLCAAGYWPLALGGDCTITLGVLAGVLRHHHDAGLMYVDGDADLNTPQGSESGVLDTMGVTHLLGGGAPALSGIGPTHPLVTADRLELFGFDPEELDTGQWLQVAALGLHATPAPVVRLDPAARAADALGRMETAAGSFLVHFDVDVLDTGRFPLANFPHFGGLGLDEVTVCLEQFCRSPRCAGLVLTEVNPDHDPDDELVDQLVAAVCVALAPRQHT